MCVCVCARACRLRYIYIYIYIAFSTTRTVITTHHYECSHWANADLPPSPARHPSFPLVSPTPPPPTEVLGRGPLPPPRVGFPDGPRVIENDFCILPVLTYSAVSICTCIQVHTHTYTHMPVLTYSAVSICFSSLHRSGWKRY